ncbi:MAG: hypothetical protein NTZ95_03405 [Candidatus Omnitrophica bacterium]|nr:hypothetical protein [Candidatus Omnitrophota bacterium]
MGNYIGQISEGSVVFSVFENEADIKGKKVLIRNIKIERRYMENGKWKTNNYFNERNLQSFAIAINKYNKSEFDKKRDNNNVDANIK